MSEFRIHHDVNELLSLLRVHGGDGAEVYIDLLQKNRTPYVTTTVSAHSAKVSAHPSSVLCTELTFLDRWSQQCQQHQPALGRRAPWATCSTQCSVALAPCSRSHLQPWTE